MFRVMTWNLENLFLPGTRFGPKTREILEAKLRGLAATINAQAPDVLTVQEVGDPEALSELVDRLDGDWDRRDSNLPDGRGIRVVALSRHPITEPDDVSIFPAPLGPVQSDDDGGTVDAMPARAGGGLSTPTGGASPPRSSPGWGGRPPPGDG